ncbi:Foldase protein PrsA [bacterium HR32]|nr:Foldase protein PrsA [bacterium HR32]
MGKPAFPTRRFSAFGLLFAVLALVGGCAGPWGRPFSGASAGALRGQEAERGGVAARVGGEIILLRWVDQDVALWDSLSGLSTRDPGRRDAMRWEVLQRWITRTLAAQEARRRGISVSPEEIDQALSAGLALPSQRRVYENLRRYGATEDDIRVRIQLDLYLSKFRSQLAREIASGVREEDAWAYYRAHQELFQHPEQVYAWVIQVREEGLARRIVKRAREGEDFGRLAEAYSVHPTRARRGEFGWLNRGGFAFEPLFLLGVGEVSDPIPYQETWLVVKVTARRPPGLWPFHEVREEARRGVVAERLVEQQRELDRVLRSRTPIVIFISAPSRTGTP